MAIYKRYNTRRKRYSPTVMIAAICIAAIFALTVWLGWYLGKKADGATALYTGQPTDISGGEALAPLSEKSIRGEYVVPTDLKNFIAADDETWASTWLYRGGKTEFSTNTDKKLGKDTTGLPSPNSFDINCGTIGLFEVSCITADEQVKGIIGEYEHSLISEFIASELDEIVLVFNNADSENYKEVLEFSERVVGAKVIGVPYEMLQSQEFFSAAADKGLALALIANDITSKRLEEDIETYAFYFTKYNLRLLLDGEDAPLIETMEKHTLLNYQFCSPSVGEE